MFARSALFATAWTVGLTAAAPAAFVYSNNFEMSTAGFSTPGYTTVLPTTANPAGPTSTYLGQFGGNSVAMPAVSSTVLTLTGLTPGVTYYLAFDLYIGATWDGNNSLNGPDRWQLRLTDGAVTTTLVDTTFSNLTEPRSNQNYSPTTYTGFTTDGYSPAGTGAAVQYLTAMPEVDRYTIYTFGRGAGNPVLGFTPTNSSVQFTFTDLGIQEICDEFWALDNVTVERLGPTATAPAPAGGLVFAGVLGLAAVGRRLRRHAGR